MNRALVFAMVFLFCLASLVSCSNKKPQLYPNEHYKQVGEKQAKADMEECMALAQEQVGKNAGGEKIAKDAGKSAIVGAVVGGVIGAFTGDFGRGAAIGGAAAGAGSATRGAVNANEPDAVYRNFVNKCMRDKGYETVGWR